MTKRPGGNCEVDPAGIRGVGQEHRVEFVIVTGRLAAVSEKQRLVHQVHEGEEHGGEWKERGRGEEEDDGVE